MSARTLARFLFVVALIALVVLVFGWLRPEMFRAFTFTISIAGPWEMHFGEKYRLLQESSRIWGQLAFADAVLVVVLGACSFVMFWRDEAFTPADRETLTEASPAGPREPPRESRAPVARDHEHQ
ncbi:MAG: hypothetical protein HN742_12495 [Lentisphaerae bacterium]|jgi:hypothetical protein|nr:hypothetical protein [Lentisphaerota bacterium]MBT4819432.1 hypothetical protein [Lentisphaerota bacterium]MBT5604890.1 hypothetical protein [Lentisphaerota bacterium]MBT7054864.1 hypothetical protein [Lentisphaerota bacterium]MBT7842688.1 hypothetical protein [Lentisphaerota bacterium]